MDLLQMVSRFHGMTYREWKSSMIIYCELILVNVFWRDVLKGFYSSGAHRGIFALLFTLKERGDIAWLWKLLCKGRIGNYVSISQLLFFFFNKRGNYGVLYSEKICLFKAEFLTGQKPLGCTFLFFININKEKDVNVSTFT